VNCLLCWRIPSLGLGLGLALGLGLGFRVRVKNGLGFWVVYYS
jgi:hypothetical protein